MYKNKKIIAVILARGGSKSVPGKNIRKLLGKPLICYSIETALKSKLIDRVIVSTDDDQIAKIAKKCGAEVPFKRPAYLATDTAHTPPVIKHAIKYLRDKENYNTDIVVTLQPTSPLRKFSDVDKIIKMLVDHKYDSVISVHNVGHFHPWWMSKMKGDRLVPFLELDPSIEPYNMERQKLPTVLRQNGSIFVTKTKALFEKNNIIIKENCGSYLMDETYSLEVDNPTDFMILEMVMKKIKRRDSS